MAEVSFDVSCKIDTQELSNAIDVAKKEIINRFDFKGTHVKIALEKESISLEAADQMKLKQMIDTIQSKIVRRNLNLKAFTFGAFETNVSGLVKCQVLIQNGLTQEQCKKITRLVKEAKLKVQARIQKDVVRISSSSKDELQKVQALIKQADFDFACIFENYR